MREHFKNILTILYCFPIVGFNQVVKPTICYIIMSILLLVTLPFWVISHKFASRIIESMMETNSKDNVI